MNFSHIKLAPRLGLAFAAMVVLSGFLGLFSLRQMSQLQEQTSTVVDNNLPSVMILSEYRRDLDLMRRLEALLLLETPVKEQGEYRASFDKTVAKFEELNRTYVEPTLIGSPGEAVLAAAFKKDLAAYIAAATRIRASAQDPGQHPELLNHMLNTTRGLYFATSEQLDKVIQYNVDQAKDASGLAMQILTGGRNWLVVTMVAAAAIAALLAVVIVRSIVHPLNRAIDAAQQVAEGNLAVELRSDGRDEVSRLLSTLVGMRDTLARITGEVRRNAESVATASAQIAQGNGDLSARTEQQAASLQQAAASMEQLGSTVRQNAENARQASQLAVSASGIASQGGEVVGEVVETMKGINEASRRIGDIIGTIDGIAFQTNILALNAAVEAARAGEQGRGFAVVAGEVRSLAQRSAEAAKEIKNLIGNSVERVEQGTALVDKAGATMTEVVTSIRRVTDIVAEISAASSEQSEGVAQVGAAVTQMDQATQQNAALVEESAAAAGSLNTQAEQLVQAMSFFRTAPGTEAARSAPAALRTAVLVPLPARAAPAPAPVAAAKPAAPARAAAPRARIGAPAGPVVPAAPVPASRAAAKEDEWESF
ncbi:methyl-accepting chemotaxis protein [Acidovorax sp. NCPPB 3859]|nr:MULTISPECIES: methyl-accepting chemotaxis protein [unclassified Acidovorax]MDA8452252.1 methyl-accepting chemotaxis protein [Acidovorax sp. GBBC 3297]MDA8461698.1 methyl-accepting chemotaxis protein [Acidovorax sp. GBBC 3333]MDA8466727.1 methyl-accepting chemotaxis protein [Acidovorax sp. GBBC 3332]MDA8471763.1 methyl-accepting chemotaxis protein [Acidovorax sp. GBBC 3299]WCM77554.1 methyl-accepting chemotaxis protein [Acidovorax sp. GBBC 712]